MSKIKLSFYGLLIGIINALFGSGGGIIAVSILNKLYGNRKKAQATAVSIILPLSLITAYFYLSKGYLSVKDAFPYIVPGFFGAVLGGKILKNTSSNILRIIFSLVMLWAGVRLIIK